MTGTVETTHGGNASQGTATDAVWMRGTELRLGSRVAEVLCPIRRDGKFYAPGGERFVPVDAAAYADLVEVGAVVDLPWHSLPPVSCPIEGDAVGYFHAGVERPV